MYHAMVVHQYVSSDRRMLDIFPGEKLIVLGQEDGWLYSSNDKGESGFVPPAFVSFLDWSPPDTSTTGSWQQP